MKLGFFFPTWANDRNLKGLCFTQSRWFPSLGIDCVAMMIDQELTWSSLKVREQLAKTIGWRKKVQFFQDIKIKDG